MAEVLFVQTKEAVLLVTIKLLDPTLDVVFKLFLLRNSELLRDMIQSVLTLDAPITELQVLNPDIPQEAPGDKGVVLDIRVKLNDGRQIDLEMQATVPPGTHARFLYYWARNFVDSIGRGDDYTLLRPCISILWFKVPLLVTPRFHSKFQLREEHSHELFSPELEFHVLELPKLGLASTERQAKLYRWARFLRARTTEELEELAREDEDGIMSTAKKVLEELSMDPEARRIASERETAVLMHRHLMNASREEGERIGEQRGRQEGREEGRQQGREEGRQQGREEGRQQGERLGEERGRLQERANAILDVLQRRGLTLTDAQRERITTCRDEATLAKWWDLAWTATTSERMFDGT